MILKFNVFLFNGYFLFLFIYVKEFKNNLVIFMKFNKYYYLSIYILIDCLNFFFIMLNNCIRKKYLVREVMLLLIVGSFYLF